ncbi:MAG: AEC family transporter, partial [Anaerolineales bacterium]|nr:AEC family transporter [Anaerolineales bacterium]
MNSLLILFANNILPIFLAAGAGYLVAKYLGVKPHSISRIAFYIFSPSLIFRLLTTSQLNNNDIYHMVGFAAASMLVVGFITWVIGRILRIQRRLLVAVVLTAMFGNSGNYGLSLNLFAFGEDALAYASLFFVTAAILTYTLGVFIASLGSSSVKKSLQGLLKVPVIYAVGLAFLFNAMNWTLPLAMDRTVNLLADAAIPVLIVLMGIQLRHTRWNGQAKALGLSNSMRLIGGPILALGLSVVFGLTGAARQAGVTEAAVPTAIMMTVLATEYNIKPSFVTTAVFTSTLLSPLTMTPLLAYL